MSGLLRYTKAPEPPQPVQGLSCVVILGDFIWSFEVISFGHLKQFCLIQLGETAKSGEDARLAVLSNTGATLRL